jgi:hypothetical protein
MMTGRQPSYNHLSFKSGTEHVHDLLEAYKLSSRTKLLLFANRVLTVSSHGYSNIKHHPNLPIPNDPADDCTGSQHVVADQVSPVHATWAYTRKFSICSCIASVEFSPTIMCKLESILLLSCHRNVRDNVERMVYAYRGSPKELDRHRIRCRPEALGRAIELALFDLF